MSSGCGCAVFAIHMQAHVHAPVHGTVPAAGGCATARCLVEHTPPSPPLATGFRGSAVTSSSSQGWHPWRNRAGRNMPAARNRQSGHPPWPAQPHCWTPDAAPHRWAQRTRPCAHGANVRRRIRLLLSFIQLASSWEQHFDGNAHREPARASIILGWRFGGEENALPPPSPPRNSAPHLALELSCRAGERAAAPFRVAVHSRAGDKRGAATVQVGLRRPSRCWVGLRRPSR